VRRRQLPTQANQARRNGANEYNFTRAVINWRQSLKTHEESIKFQKPSA
jgi:hypothetical protein